MKAPTKTRKTRYCFRQGDDLALMQTALAHPDAASSTGKKRMAAWDAITAVLNERGILAATPSLVCRVQRLMDKLNEKVTQGKQTESFTEVERLLVQFEQLKKSGGQNLPSGTASLEAGPNSEPEDEVNVDRTEELAEPLPSSRRSLMSPATTPVENSTNGQINRKNKFAFREEHDVLLLKEVLAYQNYVVDSTGQQRINWTKVTASMNSNGVYAQIHSLQTHLLLMVGAYRSRVSTLDKSHLSEKDSLLQTYCLQLDQETQATENRESTFGQRTASSATTIITEMPETLRNEDLLEVEGDRATHQVVNQSTVVEYPRRSVQSADQLTLEQVQLQTREQEQHQATTIATGTAEPGEPAAKKQKTTLEDIFRRFVSDQNELRKEELAYKKASFTAQQDLQRQTLALQRQALEVQDKALELQNKLMVLMEKVVDKIK